jgi:hypothetical protein
MSLSEELLFHKKLGNEFFNSKHYDSAVKEYSTV